MDICVTAIGVFLLFIVSVWSSGFAFEIIDVNCAVTAKKKKSPLYSAVISFLFYPKNSFLWWTGYKSYLIPRRRGTRGRSCQRSGNCLYGQRTLSRQDSNLRPDSAYFVRDGSLFLDTQSREVNFVFLIVTNMLGNHITVSCAFWSKQKFSGSK